ncbi:hypothetical protein [Chengkuizengella axinellae]|uniref:Uncharacterized protein n=1 Tax=Chengkuizengella axinellae TaxID=3064388 RepID=A0ABT9IV54_9BACL|nr:hypothetical protein [Chengkuizengella sp. 2205SS18-9]MDP5273250.1 hypothetical protein [Chengkuizengella sp. 2205SS18-9]
MGAFDKSICECCIGPMQCVLKQLVGVDLINIQTTTSRLVNNVLITNVKDFIVSTSEIGEIPVCQITEVFIFEAEDSVIKNVLSALKPIKNNKGECTCCEDPITNLLNLEIGNTLEIEFIGTNGSNTDEIIGVGEGVVVGLDLSIPEKTCLEIFSTCAITRVTPQ